MHSMSPELSLDQILSLAADGDEQAWRSLVDRYTSRIFGLIVRQCGDRDLAEEVTQATFVKVVKSIGRYSERGRFEPWLFRIAMNHLRDEMRRRKRQAITAGDLESDGDEFSRPGHAAKRTPNGGIEGGGDPVGNASRAEQIGLLRAAINRMTEADRQILTLRHTAGLTYAQIAETLDEPLGTVLARGHRALAKLQKMMGADQAPKQARRATGG